MLSHEPVPLYAFAPERLTRKLRFGQLLILDAVLQECSFSAAAHRLAMTQSAVTKSVHELECMLDAKLFDRTNRGVRPTELGQCLGDHAHVILTEMRYMTDSINELRMGDAGHLVVGVLTTASSPQISDMIQTLRQRSPKVRVSIMGGDRGRLCASLVEGRVDVIVGAIPSIKADHDERIVWHRLYEEDLCIVAGRAHPLAAQPRLSLHDLHAFSWIVPPYESAVRVEIDRLFADAQLPLPERLIESFLPVTNLGLLMDQHSVGFMPGGLARLLATSQLLACLDIGRRWSLGHVGYALQTSRPPSRITSLFIALLRQRFR